jgi:hypothetical protein
MGLGAHPPPKFLLLGKNPCVIRAKHKNFGKIMLCPDSFAVTNLRGVSTNKTIIYFIAMQTYKELTFKFV